MAFEKPTLQELAERTYRAFAANLKSSDARLWPNNVHVSAKVMAAAAYEAMTQIDYVSRQINSTTADSTFLERHAIAIGLSRNPPQYAQGTADLTGDPAQPVPAGAILQRIDGVQYEILAAGLTDGGGEVTVPVRALLPGKAGNAVPAVTLSLTVPLSRINTAAVVGTAGIGLGADTESDESLRTRVLFKKRNPPMGGSTADYVIWAQGFNQAITRVYVDPITAANERESVGIWFLMDGTYVNGIPLTADVNGLIAYLNTVKPAGAILDVAAPTPVTVDIEIDNLGTDTAAVRDAIALELEAMFRREAKVSTETEPFKLWRSKLSEAVSIATGEDHHTLTDPAADTTYDPGDIPVLGAITYI